MRKQDGFSLVELMVVLVIFMFVIAAATGMFIPLVNQFKQQSKIAETNIEGIIGLEVLRGDLDQAGFGLPWSFYDPNNKDAVIVYSEAAGAPQSAYNDSPGNPPRAIVAANDVAFTDIVNKSDYLVIKSALVAGNDAAHKWTYIDNQSKPKTRSWGSANDLLDTDNVTVIIPSIGDATLRALLLNGAAFSTKYSASSFPAEFSPTTPAVTDPTKQNELYVIYGIDPGPALKMPFNRADYYVGIPNGTAQFPGTLPSRCAAGTGVLMKAVLSHTAGVDFPASNVTPLLDCVADMQVIFGLDMGNKDGSDANGIIGTYSNADGTSFVNASSITGFDDQEIPSAGEVLAALQKNADLSKYRSSLSEIRVYVLAHEGQRDPSYDFNGFTAGACPTCMRVGELSSALLGRDFDLATIPDYKNYRWKVYSLVVKPENMNMK